MPLLPPPTNQTTGEPSFRWRRVSCFAIIGICFLHLPILALMPAIPDTAINRQIVESSFDLIGWAFLIYATGAGAQDIAAIVTTRSARPYADNPVVPTPPPPGPVADTVVVVPPPDPGRPE